MGERVFGRELVVGDVIEVWWQPERDNITELRPYRGKLPCLKGARIAKFALYRVGMTIEAGALFTRISRL